MNRDIVQRAVAVGLLLGISLLPRPLAGAEGGDEPLRIDRISIGLRGYHKLGLWTPVVCTVSLDRPLRVRLEVTAPDPDGNPVTFPTAETELPAGTHRLRGLFQSGRLNAAIGIAVRSSDGVTAARTVRPSADAGAMLHPAVAASTVLVATIGKPPGFATLQAGRSLQAAKRAGNGKNPQKPERPIQVVELEGPDRLPVDPLACEAWDALVIAGPADPDAVRNRGLRSWVRSGGHLVLCVGGDGVAAYQQTRLAEWVPVKTTGTSTLRQLTGLESFSDGKVSLVLKRPVAAARFGQVDGAVLFSEIDGPLLVRVPYGFGRVTFLGLDLTVAPFRDWKGLPDLARKLVVSRQVEARSHRRTRQGQLARSGVSELASQLHGALDHFPEVHRGSLWSAMVLMLVYLTAIGPLDYLFVHRVLKRPRLTWITFPLLVILAGGLTVWQARRVNGNRLLVSQISLVDLDVSSKEMRVRTWADVYSPRTARYGMAVDPVSLQRVSAAAGPGRHRSGARPSSAATVSWFGVPESGFGGMYRRGGFELGRAAYMFTPRAQAIENLPISIWTTKTLSATRQSSGGGLVESQLEAAGSGSRLTGTIVHHFSVPLRNWFIAYGNSVYRPRVRATSADGGDLPPGRQWSLSSPQVESRELVGFLTGSIAVRYRAEHKRDDTIRNVRMQWNPENRNPDDILRILTFHELVGGKSYTGLSNGLLRPLDLSPLLRVDRAVLFGTIDVPAARLMLKDGTPDAAHPVEPSRYTTCVRIVLPVQRTGGQRRELPKPND